MVVCCWSVQGGVGTTVVAAGLALAAARSGPVGEVLLVDLAGDLPCTLGLPEPGGPGLSEWLGAGPGLPPDALARLEVAVAPGVRLLPRGGAALQGVRGDLVAAVLAGDPRRVVVDAGRLDPAGEPLAEAHPARVLAAQAERSLVVARACVVGFRRLLDPPVRPSGLVVLRDPGRSLGAADAAAATGLPVVAELAVDPAVARAVDAGLLAARLPRSFVGALADAV